MTSLILERFESATATGLHDPNAAAEQAAVLEAAELVEQANRQAEAEALAARQMLITDALRSVAETLAASQSSAIEAVSGAVAEAISNAIPSIVEPHFASEIALSTADLLRAAEVAQARLKVSPRDESIIVETLKICTPPVDLVVEPDAGVPEGSARMSWTGGGADFDVGTWAQRVQSELTTQLQSRLNREENS